MSETIIQLPEQYVERLIESMNAGEIIEINPDGSQLVSVKKVQVDRFQGLKVEIFANEHPPPHFRVKFQSSTANFKISDCTRINGSGEILKYEKNIAEWHKEHKPLLIKVWNDTRPANCPVGKYIE